MSVSFQEHYDGYWVASADRRVRSFSWDNTQIADDHKAVFIAQTIGAGRGTVKVKLTFDGLCKDAEGEGVWTYDRERWYWRITFRANDKDYVFITFKAPRGAMPFDTFRTSAFGALYDERSLVGYVHWRITLKEVSRLYRDINPFKSNIANRLYRMLLMYPTIVTAGTAYALFSGPFELLKAIAGYTWTFYAGEIDPNLAVNDYISPWPHELEMSNADEDAAATAPRKPGLKEVK